MKTLLTFVTIIFINLNVFGQHDLMTELKAPRSDDFILDSLQYWLWDTLSINWQLQERTFYTTDENQNITREGSLVLNNFQQWTNYQQTLYNYDAENKLTDETVQNWDGISWSNVSKTIYTYDGNGDQVGLLSQNWTGTYWANSFQQIFTYDGNHNQLTRTSQYWNGTDWTNGTRQLNTYDGSNYLTQRLFQNYTTDWNDVSRSLYIYDADNDLDTLLYQKWTLGAWTDDYRNVYDFDAHHNRISILSQLAVGINYWLDQEQYNYTYDQYDNITHLIYMKYMGNSWFNIYQYNIINDENQNRVTEVLQQWDNGWVNADSTQYYYTGITAVHDMFDHQAMSIVPNPTSDYLFVEYTEPIDGMVAIYSIQGVKLLEFKSNHEQSFRINVASLMPGVYFVAFHVGRQVLTKGFEKL